LRVGLALCAILAAMTLSGMARSPESDQNTYVQKFEQPNKQKASAEPAIESSALPAKDDTHGRGKNEEDECQYRGPRWFSRFYCFFAAHEKFWVSFGTIILAAVTLILGAATVFLYLATRALVRGADKTARSQLRAYIGHEPMGAHFALQLNQANGQFEQRGPVKYFEKNFGSTPAYDLEMFVCIKDQAPSAYDGPFRKIEVMRTVAPGQGVGKIVGAKTRNQDFFLYGYVDYADCFGQVAASFCLSASCFRGRYGRR